MIVNASRTWLGRSAGYALISILALSAVACGSGGRSQNPVEPAAGSAAAEATPQTAMMTFRVDGMRRVNGAL